MRGNCYNATIVIIVKCVLHKHMVMYSLCHYTSNFCNTHNSSVVGMLMMLHGVPNEHILFSEGNLV